MNLPGITGLLPQQNNETGVKPWQVGLITGGIFAGVSFMIAAPKVKNNYVKGGIALTAGVIGYALGSSITKSAIAKKRKDELQKYFDAIAMAQASGIMPGASTHGLPSPTLPGVTLPGGTVLYPGATLAPNQYTMIANKIYSAMSGYGADDDEVYTQMKKIKNEADFNSLVDAFDIRDGWDLQQWIEDQLYDETIEKINKHLAKQKIPFAFSNLG